MRDTAPMIPPIDLTFHRGVEDIRDLPDSPAEVAVIGRSNVGKSTIVNAIGGSRKLARTSKTPGRTRELICFITPTGATVIDLPGYGYAKVSATDRAAWKRRLGRYLAQREPLVDVLLLIDGEVGPTALDKEVLAWLREMDVPFTIVATKHDKVKSSQRERRKRDLAAGCGVERGEVLWVSAERNVNVDRLRAHVAGKLSR